VSITVHPSDRSRHLVLRAGPGETIPDALVAVLKRERVSCGWLRASGVLSDVEIRAYDGGLGGLGRTRRIVGPVHALALEGAIGVADGEPSLSLRVLLARESDSGLETLAGEVSTAQTIALEAFVTALDDVTLERSLDERAGLWLLGGTSAAPAARTAVAKPPGPPAPPGAPPGQWAMALEASERVDAPGLRGGLSAASAATIPARPPRPELDLDVIVPEQGDVVEHFAFGRCEVIRSDGERLHLKVQKDGRVREIALEMLRVTLLADDGTSAASPQGGPHQGEGGPRRFKLERRL
jgi:predicted DNA-binding protein with PD1-like motif